MALRVLELFGGIGAFTQAVKSLDLPLDVVDYVEINPYSVKSYNAINGTEFVPQDITQFHAVGEKYSNIAVIMHGSPCQSFSAAGKQEGGREGSGTASSLLYETIRIVGECKPKVVIWENVPMLVSNKFKHTFMDYLRRMIAMGYRSYYKVLNAKDYGVPQNRERVFTISILGEHKPYVFPEKEPLTKRLIDVLEKNVDESYYLSDKMIEKFTWTKNGYLAAQKSKTDNSKPAIRRIGDLNKGGQKGDVLDSSGLCTTLTATDYKQPKQIIEPLISDSDTERIMQVGNCYQREGRDNPNDGRVYAVQGLAPTLNTMNGGNRQPFVALASDSDNSRVLTEFEGEQEGLIPVKENTVRGYDTAKEYSAIDVSFISANTRHSRVLNQMSHAVMTSGNEQVIVEPVNDENKVDAVGCAIRNREDGEQLEFRKDNLVSALHGNIMKSMVATPEQPSAKRRVRRIGIASENKSDTISAEINPQLVGGVGENDWGGQFHQGDRVYDANAIAVTLSSQGGGLAGGSTALYAIADTDTSVVGEAKGVTVDDAATNISTARVPQSVNPNACIDVRENTKKGYSSVDISYPKQNKRRGRVQKDVAHTLMTSGNEQAVVVPADFDKTDDNSSIHHLGWVEGENGKTHQSGAVYGTDGVASAQCIGKGAITRIMEVESDVADASVEPLIAASRGRVIGDNTNSKGGVWTQQLEINDKGICNTLSTVQKDNYVVEPTTSVKFRIRRLVPIECFRLMGFSDEAFELAKSVNSNSQLYSQAGNSIVVNVLRRIVEQLLKSVDFEGLKNNEQKSEPSQS